ncbi:NAD(P)-binding domain-containing protein [Dissulfurirhabdus thermomarina]|uniref:NAD(P)-binding domain-containing protein n=1 Tax=Dissulfurirhabdus thermomarina TaxID=1765737 RepID=A0A6N9TX63_DISTH|nr:NAD(P)-binding domain-containing protein [Dissulfurirhabdus thermomarina]NDY43066.1 NAD(P)-binding domain-containing protein [Dissulfurirhabdus thermomarina]NMX22394.1 NAD(P)-binding domain-containing protein [Dissulfurirhabdus thermomarina]
MEKAKIAVVGAGPAGIAVAVEAKVAGVAPVVVLEKKGEDCDTVVNLFHEGKRVDPVYRKVKVEPIGRLSFDTETREEFLARMDRVIEEYGLDIRYWNEVQKVVPGPGGFRVVTGGGLEVEAPVVVVAIGIFGKPVKPGYPIPKEVKDRVHFSMPKAPPEGEKILVVGGGDTAAETACFLCGTNDVTLSYRREKFFRLNETNACNLDECACTGKVSLKMPSNIQGLSADGDRVKVHFDDGSDETYDRVFYCLGGSTPQAFLEGIGVAFDGRRPKVDEAGETNIPGLFLAGDLMLEKGSIMGAFNSGKIVVDGILARYRDKVLG